METGPWPHLDRRQERGVVWGGRHRFLLEVPANFGELRKSEVQLRRILIPRTPMNKDKKKGRSCYTPALDDSLLGPPICQGLGPPPRRNRCGGALSSIRPLRGGRCSSHASRCLPSPLRFSPAHVLCPRCRRHPRLWEPPPSHLASLVLLRTLGRPAVDTKDLVPAVHRGKRLIRCGMPLCTSENSVK